MKKRFGAFLLVFVMCIGAVTACGEKEQVSVADQEVVLDGTGNDAIQIEPEENQNADNQQAEETSAPDSVTIRVGAMSGPTAMGMVKLMSDSEEGITENTYEFAELGNDASALVAPLAKGELDIAAIPSNLAANIYNNNDGAIEVLAICVSGVLNLVERGESINTIADLEGKSIYATGQGAVPEYTIRYILNANGLNPDEDVEIIWCSDTNEALAYVCEVRDAIAILPQPFVTAASAKVESTKTADEPSLRVVLDLNDAWAEVNNEGSIVTGVVVVRRDFADKNPDAVKKFLEEYEASVNYANEDLDNAAALIVKYGIVGAEGVAKKALPGCHVMCVTGDEMRQKIDGFLGILFEMNPKAIGGAMPDEAFYYIAE